MGEVVPYKPKEDPRERSGRVGVLILIGAWGMMFVSLLFIFVFVRLDADGWPPSGTPLRPRLFGALALAVAAGAAAGLHLGVRALRVPGRVGQAAGALGTGAVAALAFVIAQAALLVRMRTAGFEGSFGSLFLTAHFMHLVCAACALPGLGLTAARSARGRYGPAHHGGPSSWALYWTFVAAAWAALYLPLYWL